MNVSIFSNHSRFASSLGLAVLLSVILAGCATTEEQRRANLHQDAGTCSSFGARYGSSEHTQCMLVQQQRRDAESFASLERARISSEIAKNTQDMINSRKDRDN
jgi:hypothetical protein